MLIGSFAHVVDSKKRLSIPSKWRAVLGEKVIVTAGLDKSLFLFSLDKWTATAKEISSKGFYNLDTRNFARFILANAFELSIDSHGRILLPDQLIEFANLKDEVVLTGVYDRCEIWSKSEYEKAIKDINQNAELTASKISGLIGV
jgi:MraZ protein